MVLAIPQNVLAVPFSVYHPVPYDFRPDSQDECSTKRRSASCYSLSIPKHHDDEESSRGCVSWIGRQTLYALMTEFSILDSGSFLVPDSDSASDSTYTSFPYHRTPSPDRAIELTSKLASLYYGDDTNSPSSPEECAVLARRLGRLHLSPDTVRDTTNRGYSHHYNRNRRYHSKDFVCSSKTSTSRRWRTDI